MGVPALARSAARAPRRRRQFYEFPTIVSSATTPGSGTNTSHTVNLPSTYAAGDLLLIGSSAARRNASNVRVDAVFTGPSGFTELQQATNITNNEDVRIGVYAKISNGSEGSTVSMSTGNNSRTAHIALAIRGLAAGALADVVNSGVNFTSILTTSLSTPTLTPGWFNEATLWIAFMAHSAPETVTPPSPSGEASIISLSKIPVAPESHIATSIAALGADTRSPSGRGHGVLAAMLTSALPLLQCVP
jgi:hypothetical protein